MPFPGQDAFRNSFLERASQMTPEAQAAARDRARRAALGQLGPGEQGPPREQRLQTRLEMTQQGLLQLIEQALQNLQQPFTLAQPTPQDISFVNEIMDARRMEAMRAFTDSAADIARSVTGEFAKRGLSGSSFEMAAGGIAQRDLQRQLFDMIDRSRAEGAQTLTQLPLQRAGLELSRNQTLFNSIIGAGQPLQQGLFDVLGIGPAFQKPDQRGQYAQALGYLGAGVAGAI